MVINLMIEISSLKSIAFQSDFDSPRCNRYSSIVIDSAVYFNSKEMLFSGDQLYEWSVNRVTLKSIKQLDASLEPPIDTAYTQTTSKGDCIWSMYDIIWQRE